MAVLLTFLIYCAVAALGAFMWRRSGEPTLTRQVGFGIMLAGIILATMLVVPEIVRALVH